MSRHELGATIRGKREAITPAEVGLPAGPRRRTPGLRRTELAMLAGISVEYLTRIEQGRDRNPSPQVLGALADALLLTADERMYLLLSAKAASGTTLLACPSQQATSSDIRPTVRSILRRLEPTPAVLCNDVTDILAFTAAYGRLAGPLGLLDGEPPNLVRYLFADPRAKQALPDWEQVADQHLNALRSGFAPTDRHLHGLGDELAVLAGTEFTNRLATGPGRSREPGVERIAHPEVGEMRLIRETLHLDRQRILVYLPADEAAEAALDALVGARPGALRPISA